MTNKHHPRTPKPNIRAIVLNDAYNTVIICNNKDDLKLVEGKYRGILEKDSIVK